MSQSPQTLKMSSPLAQSSQEGFGDWLRSSTSNYKILSILGQGTFGTVVKCTRLVDTTTVAIKLMRNGGASIADALQEVAALLHLESLDSDECNLVRFYQVFICSGHICLEFENLDKSLFDFMRDRYFRPLSLREIRPIVQQVANALDHLKSVRLIHADLKLDNVMLVDHSREPYRVKLIDFGLACPVSAAIPGANLQALPYKSPEILLGLPFTEAIDMWALGCMAATLFLGYRPFPGKTKYDTMRYIVEILGQPPNNLLTLGPKTCQFFETDSVSNTNGWKLKTPEQVQEESEIQPTETRSTKLRSLYDIFHINVIEPEDSADKTAHLQDRLAFVILLSEMLHLDAAKRSTPREVLEHQFISMSHLLDKQPPSSYVRSSLEIMDVCKKKTPTSDSGSLQQPSSGTDHPVRENISTASAEKSRQSQPHFVDLHPYPDTQATNTGKSGMKRKFADDDETARGPSNVCKRLAVKSPQYQPLHGSDNTHSSNCSYPENYIRPVMKRKAVEDVGFDQNERSDRTGKRFRRSPSAPSTSTNCSHNLVSLKRKTAHGEDNNIRSDFKTKRDGQSYGGPSTSHNINNPTESRAQSGLKRKATDHENAPHTKTTRDLRPDNNETSSVVRLEEERRRKESGIEERKKRRRKQQQHR